MSEIDYGDLEDQDYYQEVQQALLTKKIKKECADRAIEYGMKSGMLRKVDCEYAQGIRRAIEENET